MLLVPTGLDPREPIMPRPDAALFVPYTADAPWIVRRARTVVAEHATQREAIDAARRLASSIARRPGQATVSVAVQAEDGSWSLLPVQRDAPECGA